MHKKNNPANFKTISEIITYHAAQNPHNIAITAPDRDAMTFAVLQKCIAEIAATLGNHCHDELLRVAIIMPEGPEMAVAFLAITSFAAAAPLNPTYKAEDFEFYLSDMQADILLIDTAMDSVAKEIAKKLAIPVFTANFDGKQVAGYFTLSNSAGALTSAASAVSDPNDIALFLHTSGTTSRPKLVPLTQRNLCVSAQNIAHTLNLSANDRCLNIMPLFHIHGLMAPLLASITAGGSVVCTPGLATDKFTAWLEKLKPTWYSGVPTMHQAILASIRENGHHLENTSLRFIRSSSSALPPPVMAELEETFKIPLLEAYGMTEAAHQMASNPLHSGPRKIGSVGLPAGPEISLLDQSGKELSNEQQGEIAIRGENITSGYLGNPQANQAAFTNGWFRTGDLGYFDQDGYLYISGRIKEIINRGGEKISPREIDEMLMDHPEISQAVAFAKPHPTLGEDLLAAVVLTAASDLNEETIRQVLFTKLPGFKVPSQILIVDEIPKGPTGKLQRIGLAEKFIEHFKPSYAAPQSELEILLAGFFSELLKIDKVGVHENFFTLGGDSLLATQLISRVTATLSINVPIITVFQAPSIAQLAVEVDKLRAQQRDPETMAELLAQIEALSDAEAERLLRDDSDNESL